jgi:hypothetical protein
LELAWNWLGIGWNFGFGADARTIVLEAHPPRRRDQHALPFRVAAKGLPFAFLVPAEPRHLVGRISLTRMRGLVPVERSTLPTNASKWRESPFSFEILAVPK